MDYVIEKALFSHLDRICELYAGARAFMARNGNPTQWGDSYPERSMLEADIAQGCLYVMRQDGQIRGVFYLNRCEDPTYAVIHEGNWHSQESYAVIHRICGDGSGGTVKRAVDFALARSSYLRIDTHADNLPMQRVLEKLGFSYCGIIYVEDGTPRLAYDKHL